ncbi:MAG: phosphate/phosphite/phosphonate ABC transporter substrate-binding protein [Actinobacteria bacterium]|nr:phosphate/phosphite/phosphonate ABC transporter substrate-binding protein [Actinomycetota bacterium]MBW3641539.1 phosphate/phosphite/phosphonate ABC transporter substrate-binding protein [Actinomycetota bacterium]
MHLRRLALAVLAVVILAACGTTATGDRAASGGAAEEESPTTLRFGVGPLLPTTEDTEAAWEPFFAWLAGELGVDYQLDATTDWAGIAVALANEQVDLAWMGPFGYVLANNQSGAQAIATVKYDGKPTYHAIVVGPPDSPVQNWPDDAQGLSMSFAEQASTSGWLVPTFFLTQRGIDPTTYFEYSEGAAHPANEIAVANRQVDLATDFDRNRNSMIESGALAPDATKIVWTSDPLPNDAIGVRPGLDPELVSRIQELLVNLTPEQAEEFMPKHYTGFVPATDDSYRTIKDAAISLDKLS